MLSPVTSSCLQHLPFTVLFTTLNSMCAGSYVIKDNCRGHSRGQAKKVPPTCYHYVIGPINTGIETVHPLIKPSFINLTTTDELSINFGYPLILPCHVEGNPIPTHEWYKDGILIPGANQPALLIREVLPDDRGNYSCKATNTEGTIVSDSTHVSIPGIQIL